MQNNHDQHQKNMSPVAAGITGLILGIVGTAAIALSDKNTRSKVTKKANEMRDNLEKWSKDTLHDVNKTGDEIKKKAAERADELKSQSASTSEEMRERADDTLREEQRKEL